MMLLEFLPVEHIGRGKNIVESKHEANQIAHLHIDKDVGVTDQNCRRQAPSVGMRPGSAPISIAIPLPWTH